MSSLIPRSSLFDDFFRDLSSPGFYIKPLHGEPLPGPGSIKIDVKENGSTYTVSAEIPGVKKEDIHVAVEGGRVTVSAEVRQEDVQKQGDKVLRSERYYGSVARSIALPQDVDSAQARAKYDNGVLTLTLPKKQGGSGQKLRIE
ncbi:MAG: Hsp20/alpha crystallin family protein [Curvibacter sp.]